MRKDKGDERSSGYVDEFKSGCPVDPPSPPRRPAPQNPLPLLTSTKPDHISSMRDAWSKAIGRSKKRKKPVLKEVTHKSKQLKEITGRNRILLLADYVINEYGSSLNYMIFKKLVLERSSETEWNKFRSALRLKFARRVERNRSDSKDDMNKSYDSALDSFTSSYSSESFKKSDDLLIDIDKRKHHFIDFHLLKECEVVISSFPFTRTKRVWIPHTVLIREGVLEYYEKSSKNLEVSRTFPVHSSCSPSVPNLTKVMSSSSHHRSSLSTFTPPRPKSLCKTQSHDTGLKIRKHNLRRTSSSSIKLIPHQFVLLKHFELSSISTEEKEKGKPLFTFTIGECVSSKGNEISLRFGGYQRKTIERVHEALTVMLVTKAYIRPHQLSDLKQIGKGTCALEMEVPVSEFL